MGDITDTEDGLEYLAELDALWVPAHARMMAGMVDLNPDDAVEATQDPLVQPQAGGAADVLQQQRGLTRTPGVAHESALNLGVIVEIEFAHDLGHHVGGD